LLGLTVGWEDWETLTGYRDQIMTALAGAMADQAVEAGAVQAEAAPSDAAEENGQPGAPEALIRVLLDIYAQYVEQRKAEYERLKALPEDPDQHIYFGPWMWRLEYALSRMQRRLQHSSPKIAGIIKDLQAASLQPGQIRLLGLAARWVEFLMRKEKE
jgi:hypothetical protein